MVFESILADLLNRFLGDYVQNFDSSKLKLGIWGGDVTLKHLDIKESALDDLDLPVRVISGHLGQLILKIPWKNMYTAPVIATIEGLYLVVVPNLAVKYDAEKEEKAKEAAKQTELERIEEAKLKEAQKKDTKEEKKDTFTEKLVTQIIKNLQVVIKEIHIRYEDSVSDRQNPFGFGITLNNLSFETTDEKWIPTIIQENVSVIHKLITLDSLAFYWNSNTKLFNVMSPEERQACLKSLIASSTFRPSNAAYMLGPINSTAQLRLNSKPEIDNFKNPKVWLNVIMEEIAVGLSKRQFRDLMKMLEAFDRMTIASVYRKYRPDVPHTGHAKEWWNFAIAAILEEDVRRKRKNWSWEHMKSHRDQCKKYKELYVAKLTGKKLPQEKQEQLCECEKNLDLFNITVARKQAELEHSRKAKQTDTKPKSWGSWLGGWFYSAPNDEPQEDSAGKKIVKQFEEAMTAEEKAKLYEAIGYQEQLAVTEYPKEFVENKLLFLLRNLTLLLSDDTASEPQIVKANLQEVSACVSQRPAADAINVEAKMESFVVRGVPQSSGCVPNIVTSLEIGKSMTPLLSVVFETNPLDGSCDQRLDLDAQPLEVIYDACTINRLAEVFKPPEQVDLQQLQAAALIKLEEMKEMSAFGLQYAIEQHKQLDLKVNVKPSFIIIPENGYYKDNIYMMVLSLGNFRMDSLKRDPESPTVRSMVKAGSTEDEVMSTMIEKAYDKFHIAITNAEILLASPNDDWRKSVGSPSSNLHLLHPVSINIDFHKSIVSVDPRMPKMRIAAELPLLDLSLSDEQILSMLQIAKSIPLPEADAKPPEVTKPRQSKAAIAVDINTVNAKVLNKAKREAVETYKSSSSDSEETDHTSDGTRVQRTDMEFKFEITKFNFAFSYVVDVGDTRTLHFAFYRFGTSVTMRTFDLSSDIYLGGILLEYSGIYTKDKLPIKLISSSVDESEENLFSIRYLQADKKGPDFATVYGSTLQNIDVTFKDIRFVLHQDVILAIMTFSNKLITKLELMESSQAAIAMAVANKEVIKDTKEKSDKLVPSKRKKPTEVIDVKLHASLDTMHVLICNTLYDLTDMNIKGMSAVITMDKAKTSVVATWKDLIVYDPSPKATYSKIITTDRDEVLDLKLVMYNNATDDENYLDLNAVDISVIVSFGRMKIVFLNKFISSLLFFLDHFQEAKEKVAEASAVAAEAARHGMEHVYEKATRILLQISIQAPEIIVPQNSSSRNTLVADLGVLKISNRFEFGQKRNELGIPAVLDKMFLNLENFKLSRALVDPTSNNSIAAECPILEPLSFCLAVIRNLSSSWYLEHPEVDVFGKLEAVKIAMSNDDYATALSVLSGNLAETHEEVIANGASVGSVDVTAGVTHHTTNETVHVKPELPAKISDFIHPKVYTRFKFAFEMDSALVQFYLGTTQLTKRINEHDANQSMGVMDVEKILFEAEMYSDSSMKAKVLLRDFTMEDTRVTRTTGVKRLMERTSEKSSQMISVLFDQKPTGDKTLDVKICSFTLVACLPYIMKLGEFFSSMETIEDKLSSGTAAAPEAKKEVVRPTAKPAAEPITGTTVISLTVEQPDIVLIEDMENLDSNAIFLNNEISAKITITDAIKIISGKISNLTFYTATYDPAKRLDSMVKILNPSEIDLQCNLKPESQHIDILLKDIVLQIQPSTVELITNILSSLVTEKSVEEEEKEEVLVDHSGLWEPKPLSICNFSFLETLSGRERAIEATECLEDSSDSDIMSSEQMLFTVRKVIITVEAGVGTRTVPMLLLESSFQAQVCDWSSEINIESSLSIEISYYNEKIAVWEPLLEPVETTKGHRSWELFMEMSRRGDIDPAFADELEEIPPVMKFEIRSDDIMELTVSKTCIDVLTTLSEAFTEAVKQTTVRENKLPYAPFRVYNHLGLPVTIVLNDTFQILDSAENYGSVILESGSPPLHLTQNSQILEVKNKSKARPSMLKKQFMKDDTCFNIMISLEDLNIERALSITCTDKRYFQLPRRTYPGDKWAFIVDIASVYGCKVITFLSPVQVFNHFSVPIDVFYMVSTASEVKWCGTVKPNKQLNLPLHSIYTITGELFFKPTDMQYSLSLQPFVWKQLIEDPSVNKILQCEAKDVKGNSFFINVAGEVERILFEETNKKTVSSSLYKLNLYPTVRLRNLLLYPVNYSVLGLDKDFKLEEGQTDELWPAEIDKTGLEIRLCNYLDRTWVSTCTLTTNVDELSVWTFTTHTGDGLKTMELGMRTQKINGSLIMELYSPYCMINKTGLLLIYRVKEVVLGHFDVACCNTLNDDEGNIIYHPAEVEQPVLFSFKAKAFFSKKKASLKIKDSEWSDKFSIDAVGSSGNVIAKSKAGKTYGIGVQIKLSQSGLTKMIIFTPFYIIVNSCKYDIECLEDVEGADWIQIKKGECVPFWPVDTSKALMIARYSDDQAQTNAFSYKNNQTTLLRLNSCKGGIQVECQVAQSSIILTFEDYATGQAPALLINHMAEYTVTFNQMGCSNQVTLPPYTCILYCWEDPTAKRVLLWKCGDKEGLHDLVKDEVAEFHPESGAVAYWLSFLDGMQRVFVFTHDLNRACAIQAACQAVQMDQEFVVTLQGVGVSLVNNDTRLEIMYMGITSSGIVWEGKKEKRSRFKPLSLKECLVLETGFQRYQGELKIGNKPKAIVNLDGRIEVDFTQLKMLKPVLRDLKRTFQTGLWLEYKAAPGVSFLHAKINRLQIDNQLTDCVFPVVLAPVPLPKSVAAESAPKPFTELSIMLRKEAQSTVQQIKYCKILIQEFHVKLDQGFINSMISFFTPEKPTEVNYVKIIALDSQLAHSGLKDVAAIYSSQEQKCYYDNLHFSPLKVHISFSMTGGGSDDKPTPIHSDLLNILLQSVGVTLTEIQDVIFKLDYFERQHVFMSTQQLINEATSHYVGQAVKQLYMLVLGLDVIGNPVGLFLGLGEGVTDFFYEPFQGAIQGPEEFFEGLGLGVKSLFGHAIGGTAGAASRITGTLAKGIAALTLDKDYQRRRRQNLNRRPQDVTQRLAQSGKGLVMGVFDGMTGIVRQPWEGAKEEGGWGFAKGMAKGLIGVVARPTAGAVDFVSGTFDSVKRIAELQDEVKRLRPPRYIRSDGVIRPYIRLESVGNRLLQELEKGKYVNTDVYEGHIPVGTDQKSCLVITNNRIMYVTKGDVFGQWNTEWEYRWAELKGVPILTENGIKIMLKDPHRKKMSFFGSKVAGKLVHAVDTHQCEWIVSKIEEIMRNQT